MIQIKQQTKQNMRISIMENDIMDMVYLSHGIQITERMEIITITYGEVI
jgi:hypothetical protein